ncbi:hypothetical protein D3C72_939080 [compost metagenome]
MVALSLHRERRGVEQADVVVAGVGEHRPLDGLHVAEAGAGGEDLGRVGGLLVLVVSGEAGLRDGERLAGHALGGEHLLERVVAAQETPARVEHAVRGGLVRAVGVEVHHVEVLGAAVVDDCRQVALVAQAAGGDLGRGVDALHDGVSDLQQADVLLDAAGPVAGAAVGVFRAGAEIPRGEVRLVPDLVEADLALVAGGEVVDVAREGVIGVGLHAGLVDVGAVREDGGLEALGHGVAAQAGRVEAGLVPVLRVGRRPVGGVGDHGHGVDAHGLELGHLAVEHVHPRDVLVVGGLDVLPVPALADGVHPEVLHQGVALGVRVADLRHALVAEARGDLARHGRGGRGGGGGRRRGGGSGRGRAAGVHLGLEDHHVLGGVVEGQAHPVAGVAGGEGLGLGAPGGVLLAGEGDLPGLAVGRGLDGVGADVRLGLDGERGQRRRGGEGQAESRLRDRAGLPLGVQVAVNGARGGVGAARVARGGNGLAGGGGRHDVRVLVDRQEAAGVGRGRRVGVAAEALAGRAGRVTALEGRCGAAADLGGGGADRADVATEAGDGGGAAAAAQGEQRDTQGDGGGSQDGALGQKVQHGNEIFPFVAGRTGVLSSLPERLGRLPRNDVAPHEAAMGVCPSKLS